MKLEELRIYQRANEISDEIWQLVTKMSYFEKDTIGKQLARSADSISANIAEGYGRFFYKENRQFCFYSRGSLTETQNWLGKCNRRQIIDVVIYEKLNEQLNDLHKSLNAYIKTLGKAASDN
ncbi:four helix bundle protein [Roseivirga sp.]|uniref:four helix bundle protein n=1 Tax=Roseivirga sp. TaxID=1964215 RepID=UPI003B8CAFF9